MSIFKNQALASLFEDVANISSKYDVDYSVLHDDTDTRSEEEYEDRSIYPTAEDLLAEQQRADDNEAYYGNY